MLPETVETFDPDTKIKTVIKYRINSDGNKEKVTTKYSVKTITKRVRIENSRDRGIEERKNWEKFGKAALGNEGCTTVSRDEIFMTKPGEEDDKPLFTLKKKPPQGIWKPTRSTEQSDAVENDKFTPKNPNSYVVPGMRNGTGGTSMYSQDDGNTLRISNISEDITEDNLRHLFDRFGRITRLKLVKDRETEISRGFAYVTYCSRDDAEDARARLDGHAYGHLIMSVQWSEPRRN